MSIAVRCTNILRYDPQQGKYLRCNHEFKVKGELAGQSVRCPQCGQRVDISEANIVRQHTASPAPAVSAGSAAKDRAAEGPSRVEPHPAASLPPASSKLAASPQPGAAADDYPEVLEDDEEFRLLEPVELPSRDFSAASPPSSLPLPSQTPAASPRTSVTPPPLPGVVEEQLPGDEKAPCPGCGNPLMTRSVICPACGYHKGLKRRVSEFEKSEGDEDKPTGFERWLRKQLAEGQEPGAIRSILIIGGLLLVTFGVVLFLMIGHLVWIFVGAAGVLAAGAWLGWWKLDPWQWLLFANRMIGWRQPLPPFAHRKVLDLRNMPMGDAELGALKNLAEFDVIDLEGASITDHGLPTLYDYRNLQFIILRGTQTTEDGARQLQQALPSAWIWR